MNVEEIQETIKNAEVQIEAMEKMKTLALKMGMSSEEVNVPLNVSKNILKVLKAHDKLTAEQKMVFKSLVDGPGGTLEEMKEVEAKLKPLLAAIDPVASWWDGLSMAAKGGLIGGGSLFLLIIIIPLIVLAVKTWKARRNTRKLPDKVDYSVV